MCIDYNGWEEGSAERASRHSPGNGEQTAAAVSLLRIGGNKERVRL